MNALECHACRGEGHLFGACLVPQSHHSPAEYDSRECTMCRGTGEVPALVPVVLAFQLFWPKARLELQLVASVRLARAGVRKFRAANRVSA